MFLADLRPYTSRIRRRHLSHLVVLETALSIAQAMAKNVYALGGGELRRLLPIEQPDA